MFARSMRVTGVFKLGLAGAATGVVGALGNGSVLISAKVFGWKFSLKCSPLMLIARQRNLLALLASIKAISELVGRMNAF